VSLNVSFPLVDDQGMATDIFRFWLNSRDPLTGAGSPEAVVTASQFTFYINTSGATGTLLYIKMLPDIGGDKSQGWVAV
jgi:hypothetical protein